MGLGRGGVRVLTVNSCPPHVTDVAPQRKPRTPLQTFKKVGIPIIAALLGLAAIVVVAILSK